MAMDDTGPNTAWAEWVNAQFAAHGEPKQLDVAKAVGLGNSAISKWRKGQNPADADTAVRAAKYFGRPPYEALRAAGHTELADLLDPATIGLPEPEPNDPVAEEIMGWTHLSLKVRRALLEEYRADFEAAIRAAHRRIRATAELLESRKDGA